MAAAAAFEETLAPAPTRVRREAPAPARPRREAPTRARTANPRRTPQRADHAPRLALRLQPPRLDRIVRGRAWIPVLGAMLVAIVGLRVVVLKLGARVGSQIQQATLLESSNATLRTRISALSDNRRIEALAQGLYGMHMPSPLDIHIVQSATGSHLAAAIHNISAPARSNFLTGLVSEQQASERATAAIAAVNGTSVTATTTSTATGSTQSTVTGSTQSTATGSTQSTATGVAQSTSTGSTSTGGVASSTGSTSGATTAGQTGTAATTGTGTAGTTGTGTGTPATSSTTGTAAGDSTTGTGSSGLNTGVTNTAAAGTSQGAGSTGSPNGGTGLAG